MSARMQIELASNPKAIVVPIDAGSLRSGTDDAIAGLQAGQDLDPLLVGGTERDFACVSAWNPS
jgi:hypothetical protein